MRSSALGFRLHQCCEAQVQFDDILAASLTVHLSESERTPLRTEASVVFYAVPRPRQHVEGVKNPVFLAMKPFFQALPQPGALTTAMTAIKPLYNPLRGKNLQPFGLWRARHPPRSRGPAAAALLALFAEQECVPLAAGPAVVRFVADLDHAATHAPEARGAH